MRKFIYCYIIIFLFFSCKKKDEGLNEELYHTILKYQKENDFSKSKDSTSHFKNYVYEVHFEYKKDTTISISIEPEGYIGQLKNAYGIYSDNNLKPTIIVDENKIGKKFVNEYRKKNLESFHNPTPVISDIFIPIYVYKIKKGKILFSGKG